MRATLVPLAALLLLAGAALAQPNPYSCGPRAPDTCGPGFLNSNPYGMVYGPNYWLRPPFPPVGGVPPSMNNNNNQSPNFPTHPYARGPRDFFMVYDNWFDITQYPYRPW